MIYDNIFYMLQDIKNYYKSLYNPSILPMDNLGLSIKGYSIYTITPETGEEEFKFFEIELKSIFNSIKLFNNFIDVNEIYELLKIDNLKLWINDQYYISNLEKIIEKYNNIRIFV